MHFHCLRRDRRGAGIVEYALLILLMLVAAALVFKLLGGRVKHAGSKTEEQFAGQSADSAGKGGGGAGDKPAPSGGSGAGANTTSAGPSPSGGAAGGGGGGGTAEVKKHQVESVPNDEEEVEYRGTPRWKYVAALVILLFTVGGYYAFKKSKK